MEKKQCRFSYNDWDDSLLISFKSEDENVKERFEMGNFIFHQTGRGKLVGLQILDVSRVFEDYNINSSFLGELNSVEIEIQKEKDLLGIALIFNSSSEQKKMPIQMLGLQTAK